MDLIGPIGAEVSGGKAGAKPRHILVITDPYSHIVWLETITTKSAEEVYDKFVNRFMLEEGCPKVILTDNGREFSSELLREHAAVQDKAKVHVIAPPAWELYGACQPVRGRVA